MRCDDAMRELMKTIADDASALSAEARAHLRDCARCREVLGALSDRTAVDDAPVDASAGAAERALGRERRKVLFVRATAIAVALAVFGILYGATSAQPLGLARDEFLVVFFAGICIAILVAAPLLLLFSAIAHARTPAGRRFYKRLGPGRWLDGVCLGIAEGTGWNVGLVRLAFVLACVFGKGLGVLAYLVATAAMPVHPADRTYLFRFKIARAWRRMRHGSEEAEQHG